MKNKQNNQEQNMAFINNPSENNSQGQRWLVEERDACGVGFIAHRRNQASHEVLVKALAGLTCLEHRGGCSADRDSGDGAGILTAIPWELFQTNLIADNIKLPQDIDRVGVGMIFLPNDKQAAQIAKKTFEAVASEEKLTVLGWRTVPVKPEVLGTQAKENQPRIEQVFLLSDDKSGDELERQLYITRGRIVKAIRSLNNIPLTDFYVCSLSSRTIIYKGMVRSAVLAEFYADLKDPQYTSAFAVYHRRFSTNTLPKWPLAQPMRLLGHNGEINTLVGNVNWMMARDITLDHPIWKKRLTFIHVYQTLMASNKRI